VNGANVISAGKTGVYRVNLGNSSSYRIVRDAYNYPMPEGTQLTAGNVHCFTFDGTNAVYNTTQAITLENVE
jgi:hypothetical protein